jgi:hypothetical protein
VGAGGAIQNAALPGKFSTVSDPVTISPLAGKPAAKAMLVDLARLEREYYARVPDPDDPAQRVSFGTSGHRARRCTGRSRRRTSS